MRRITAWVGGVAGGIAAYRLLRRRPQAEPEPAPGPEPTEPDDRADELRAKLAESREAEPEPGQDWRTVPATPPIADGPAADEPEPAEPGETESPEERRRRVHEEGRATLDEMKPEETS